MYTANSRLTHEKAPCEWFRNMSKRNVVRATPAVVELKYDWLNRLPEPGDPVSSPRLGTESAESNGGDNAFRVSDDSLNCFY